MSPLFRWVVKWARTVHLYLTLFCLALLLFFGVTGFMLNHEGWFVSSHKRVVPCEVPADWVRVMTEAEAEEKSKALDRARKASTSSAKKKAEEEAEACDPPTMHELQIVELLRAKYGVVGSLSTVEDLEAEAAEPAGRKPLLDVSPDEVRAVFKRPGSQITAVIYREEREADGRTFKPGQGEITFDNKGVNGLLLDLHRGKDTSGPWHFVIDAVAVVYLIVAATGIVMWLSLKGRGKYGLWVVIAGVVLSVAVVWVFELLLVRN